MKNDYVSKHDFGYAKAMPENSSINKLRLRNINDLTYYIINLINDDVENANIDERLIVSAGQLPVAIKVNLAD